MVRIESIGLPSPALAGQLLEVWQLARVQEVALVFAPAALGAPPSGIATEPATPPATEAALKAATESATDSLIEDLKNESFYRIVAFEGEQVLGWISVAVDDEPGQMCIELLVVRPQCQRQGIGRLLVERVLALSGAAPVAVVTTATNGPALALYRQFGFVHYRSGSRGELAVRIVKLRTAGRQAQAHPGG
jgi:ribosomal protein S18 acetylase RimI-like enzyme